MTRCIAIFLCLALFNLFAHADKEKKANKIHAQIQCYHYDPTHPYLEPDDISEALAYAAWRSDEFEVPISTT